MVYECLCMRPKWNPIPYTVHYFWPESKVVFYVGNRVPLEHSLYVQIQYSLLLGNRLKRNDLFLDKNLWFICCDYDLLLLFYCSYSQKQNHTWDIYKGPFLHSNKHTHKSRFTVLTGFDSFDSNEIWFLHSYFAFYFSFGSAAQYSFHGRQASNNQLSLWVLPSVNHSPGVIHSPSVKHTNS